MTKEQMPLLQPIPIKTKHLPWWRAVIVWLTSRRKWEFTEDWEHYMVAPDELIGCYKLCIAKGFVFDGASIPRPFTALLAPTGLLFIPAVFHDFVYTHGYMSLDSRERRIYGTIYNRHEWDTLFRKVAIDINGMKWLNYIAWAALYCFAGPAWRNCQASRDEYRLGKRVD